MLILLKGNLHVLIAGLCLCVQEQKVKKLDMILTKADTLEGLTPLSQIQYAYHSAIFEFANKRGTKHLDKAKNLLERLES